MCRVMVRYCSHPSRTLAVRLRASDKKQPDINHRFLFYRRPAFHINYYGQSCSCYAVTLAIFCCLVHVKNMLFAVNYY